MSTAYLKTNQEKLEYFVNLLKSSASGKDVSESEYLELREYLLSDKVLEKVLPSFVKTNGELNAFWRFIQDKVKGYSQRREFLTKEFEPALSMLEAKQISIPIAQKYTHNQASIKQEIKEYFTKNGVLQNIYGEFKLVDKNIGNGGTSEVKGFEFKGKRYAVKFLLEDISKKESEAFKRFKQAHLNLVGIQHSGSILPQLHFDRLVMGDLTISYIIMPRVEKTLKTYVKEKKKNDDFSFELFEKIFDNLLKVIETIHQLQIIHRDIKPENIFLFEGKFVLGDFDIANFDKELYIKLIKTKPADRLANYNFSAPEQVKVDGGELTTSADWFAFAQVLYWMVTGDTLRGQSKIELTQDDARYKKYESLIANLLSENPLERFSSKEKILKSLNKKKRLEPDDILFEFEDIIFKHMFHLGQSEEGFKKFDDIESINEIMSDLHENEATLNLWLSQGYSDINVKTIKQLELCERCWLVGYREMKIKSIWIFKHHYNLGCSCIIIETDRLESSGVYKTTPEWEDEEFGLYKEHYIKREQCYTGWTEIDGKKVKLNGESEIRVRNLKENIYFIAPQNGPLVRHDKIIDSIYKRYKEIKVIDEELLLPLKDIKKARDF